MTDLITSDYLLPTVASEGSNNQQIIMKESIKIDIDTAEVEAGLGRIEAALDRIKAKADAVGIAFDGMKGSIVATVEQLVELDGKLDE